MGHSALWGPDRPREGISSVSPPRRLGWGFRPAVWLPGWEASFWLFQIFFSQCCSFFSSWDEEENKELKLDLFSFVRETGGLHTFTFCKDTELLKNSKMKFLHLGSFDLLEAG